MSIVPPVPEDKSAASTQMSGGSSFSGAGAGSDPIESTVLDSQAIKTDNAVLTSLRFAHQSKVHAFYFSLGAVTFLFLVGTLIFWCVSSWRYGSMGWHAIFILLAFFTPATVIVTVLIRVIFASDSSKDEAKKDDLADMLPSAQVIKLVSEALKANKP